MKHNVIKGRGKDYLTIISLEVFVVFFSPLNRHAASSLTNQEIQ